MRGAAVHCASPVVARWTRLPNRGQARLLGHGSPWPRWRRSRHDSATDADQRGQQHAGALLATPRLAAVGSGPRRRYPPDWRSRRLGRVPSLLPSIQPAQSAAWNQTWCEPQSHDAAGAPQGVRTVSELQLLSLVAAVVGGVRSPRNEQVRRSLPRGGSQVRPRPLWYGRGPD